MHNLHKKLKQWHGMCFEIFFYCILRNYSNHKNILTNHLPTWRLVKTRVSTRQDTACGKGLIQSQSHQIREILKSERRRQAEVSRDEIKSFLLLYHKEAWHRMKGWHNATYNRASHPARVTPKQITTDWLVLYFHIPPPEENTPIYVELFTVDALVPTEDYIKWAVRRMRYNRSRGATGLYHSTSSSFCGSIGS